MEQLKPIDPFILEIRGQKVLIDSHLAAIYGVETRSLMQAVKRNAERFPADFAFRLSKVEYDSLRSQFVISKGRGGRRHLPYAFTEHGAIMAANVLNSKKAVLMSVFVVRAFVRLREVLATHKELADKLNQLERKVGTHDKALVSIIAAIRSLTEAPPATASSRTIGFRAKPNATGKPNKLTTRARKK